MVHPNTLNQRPALGMLLLGGMAATLLASALLFLTPALAFPAPAPERGLLDLPRLVGGLFTADPGAAFWLGFWLCFACGVLVFAPLLGAAWRSLPGGDVGFPGALAKGAVWGLLLWVLAGSLLPLFGALNRLGGAGVVSPGFFAAGRGPLGAAGLLLVTLCYGVAAALVAAMAQGIRPLETLGWEGYRPGEQQKEAVY